MLQSFDITQGIGLPTAQRVSGNIWPIMCWVGC